MVSDTADAVRMRRTRAHQRGEHDRCLPSSCQLTLSELIALRQDLAVAARARQEEAVDE